MKYGESAFDILYLIIAVGAGVAILHRRKDGTARLMGAAVLILGLGDAFHLVPRVLNYFVPADFTLWLGLGKLVTSLTMTVFYVLVYYIWRALYGAPENRAGTRLLYILAAVRALLCLLPQNRWLQNGGSVLWGTVRNVPFVLLGAWIAVLWFRTRGERPGFRRVWLYVTLSFLFYIPVAVGASALPLLGMLMLPKTVCYILLIAVFCRYALGEDTESGGCPSVKTML